MQQKTAPTRSNLLRMRQALKLAQEGYEILDKKREVLTSELIHQAHNAATQQTQVWQKLAVAYQALVEARLSMGREHLEWTALAVNKSVEVEIKLRSIMGVVIPTVEAHGEPPEIPYGLGDTTVALDEAVARFRKVLDEIPMLSEMMISVWRLARELQKTQRRVNALQYIFIPEYEEIVKFIESALEEREREEVFRLKRLKSKATTARVGPTTREYQQPYRDIGGGKPTSYEFG
ncbi:MAG: V-type ATP synthase subunit D [Anaerolineae bacterium]|nr:V-type ATP synthase subunit D [Anaerolineae bacterium]